MGSVKVVQIHLERVNVVDIRNELYSVTMNHSRVVFATESARSHRVQLISHVYNIKTLKADLVHLATVFYRVFHQSVIHDWSSKAEAACGIACKAHLELGSH